MASEVKLVESKPAVASGTIQGNIVSLGAIGAVYAQLEPMLDILQTVSPQFSSIKIQVVLIAGAIANLYSIYKRYNANKDLKGIFRSTP